MSTTLYAVFFQGHPQVIANSNAYANKIENAKKGAIPITVNVGKFTGEDLIARFREMGYLPEDCEVQMLRELSYEEIQKPLNDIRYVEDGAYLLIYFWEERDFFKIEAPTIGTESVFEVVDAMVGS